MKKFSLARCQVEKRVSFLIHILFVLKSWSCGQALPDEENWRSGNLKSCTTCKHCKLRTTRQNILGKPSLLCGCPEKHFLGATWFVKVTIGLLNAPVIFQRFMQNCLEELCHDMFMSYWDDYVSIFEAIF